MIRESFLGVIAVWSVFGDPIGNLTSISYPQSDAPWETVDLYFYPDKHDLSNFSSSLGVGSLQDCRDEAKKLATGKKQSRNGPDYECGIGHIQEYGSLKVYRLTMR